MFKKLVPVLGALLIAGPVLTVTTAVAADASTQTTKVHHKATAKAHHKATKKSSHAKSHAAKKHAKAKKKVTQG